jgi:hypothetical protein
MSAAFRAIKTENITISTAAKSFGVTRMSLSDRVNHKEPLHKSKMGVKTVLTDDKEIALCNYITYMANRGFPLSVPQLLGFAWCIAKERNKEDIFTKNGPSS